MVFPLLWLSVYALFHGWWGLAAALSCSFLGDVMGWKNELVCQIGFFALAQILYIIIFTLLMPPRATPPASARRTYQILLATVYGTAMCCIFPRVENDVVAYGIAVYALLLLGMCYAALRHKDACLNAGAVLFVVSDFVLGIHLFVSRIPHSALYVMVPYYTGQLLLFISCWRRYNS